MAATPSRGATFLGFLALAFWATSIALTRRLAEQFSPLASLGLCFTAGGALWSGIDWIRLRRFPAPWRLPPACLFACGPFFIAYLFLYGLGFGMASTQEAVLPLSVVNYLWPALTLLLAAYWFPGNRRWGPLALGLACSVAGVAVTQLGGLGLAGAVGVFGADRLPFAMVLGGAAAWALYSNATRRWARGASGVPFYQMATGALALALAWSRGELPSWDQVPAAAWWQAAYYAVFVAGAASWLWDWSMQQGDMVLLGIMANFLPLFSLLFSAWLLEKPLERWVGLGCLLLVAGAFLCRRGVTLKK